ncbi:MAG: PDZ domain-containing protein [Gemmataceae bacterium]|nr:PDZ domain-containing protein [Gemmataceae bacterium]
MRRSLAALLLFGMFAVAAPAPAPKADDKKEEPKKADPKPADPKPPFVFPPIVIPPGAGVDAEALKRMQERMMEMQQRMMEKMKEKMKGADKDRRERMEKHQEMMKRQMEEMLKRLPGAGGGGFRFPPVMGDPFAVPGAAGGRLGAPVQRPSETIIEQLDLPKDQGLVLGKPSKDSPAGKAGLKAHDVLLELGGKAVGSDPAKLDGLLKELKPGEAVDAVILRKGKKETVKGLKLPEAK